MELLSVKLQPFEFILWALIILASWWVSGFVDVYNFLIKHLDLQHNEIVRYNNQN